MTPKPVDPRLQAFRRSVTLLHDHLLLSTSRDFVDARHPSILEDLSSSVLDDVWLSTHHHDMRLLHSQSHSATTTQTTNHDSRQWFAAIRGLSSHFSARLSHFHSDFASRTVHLAYVRCGTYYLWPKTRGIFFSDELFRHLLAHAFHILDRTTNQGLHRRHTLLSHHAVVCSTLCFSRLARESTTDTPQTLRIGIHMFSIQTQAHQARPQEDMQSVATVTDNHLLTMDHVSNTVQTQVLQYEGAHATSICSALRKSLSIQPR